MNDLTKIGTIPEETAYRVAKRKDKEKRAELGLTVSGIAGLAASAGLQLAKEARKPVKQELVQKLKKAKEFKKVAESDFYDNPDVPLPESTKQNVLKARQARQAITEYKKDAISSRGWQMAEDMPQGIDVIGNEYNGMFVKEAKPDSVWRKDLSPRMKKELVMNKGGYRGEPISETRKRIMNRIIMQEQLGSDGTDTYFYRRKKGSPVTMAQELITPAKHYPMTLKEIPYGMDRIDVLHRDRDRLIKNAIKKGIIPDDIHFSNFGYDAKGKPKIMDLGHSSTSDYEKLVRQDKFRKALNSVKNVMSPKNKRLYIKMAKQAAKRLPMIGGIATAAGIAAAPRPAEAATEFAMDEATMGLMAPSEIGGGDLPPEVLANQRAYNAKMKLEQAKKAKQLRQQRRQ